jgi:hypothetical protein
MCQRLCQEIEEVLEREKFRRWLTLEEVADFMTRTFTLVARLMPLNSSNSSMSSVRGTCQAM